MQIVFISGAGYLGIQTAKALAQTGHMLAVSISQVYLERNFFAQLWRNFFVESFSTARTGSTVFTPILRVGYINIAG